MVDVCQHVGSFSHHISIIRKSFDSSVDIFYIILFTLFHLKYVISSVKNAFWAYCIIVSEKLELMIVDGK